MRLKFVPAVFSETSVQFYMGDECTFHVDLCQLKTWLKSWCSVLRLTPSPHPNHIAMISCLQALQKKKKILK